MIIIININGEDLSDFLENSWMFNNLKREQRPIWTDKEESLDPQEEMLLEGYSLWFDEEFVKLNDKEKELFLNKKIAESRNKEEEKSLYITLTELFYNTQQFKRIMKMSDYIFNEYPEDLLYLSVFHYYKGVSHIELEEFEQAVENLEIADGLNQNQHEYIRQLGYSYFCLGEQYDSDELIDKGMILLKRALNMTPDDLKAEVEEDLQFCFECEKEKWISNLKKKNYKSAQNSFQRILDLKVANNIQEEIKSYLGYTKYMNWNKNEWLQILKENLNKSPETIKFKKNMKQILSKD